MVLRSTSASAPGRGGASAAYKATNAQRRSDLRGRYPGALSAAEAIRWVGRGVTTFYRLARRYGIHPLVKTSHLTLYARSDVARAVPRTPVPLAGRGEAPRATGEGARYG